MNNLEQSVALYTSVSLVTDTTHKHGYVGNTMEGNFTKIIVQVPLPACTYTGS